MYIRLNIFVPHDILKSGACKIWLIHQIIHCSAFERWIWWGHVQTRLKTWNYFNWLYLSAFLLPWSPQRYAGVNFNDICRDRYGGYAGVQHRVSSKLSVRVDQFLVYKTPYVNYHYSLITFYHYSLSLIKKSSPGGCWQLWGWAFRECLLSLQLVPQSKENKPHCAVLIWKLFEQAGSTYPINFVCRIER